MKIHSYNEWDRLREIVVGSATGANWPSDDPIFQKDMASALWKETPPPSGAVPDWVINEANEDLDGLCEILKKAGVTVHRPRANDFVASRGMYNYCPRDRLLIAGDKIVDTAMMFPCRDQEINYLDAVTENNTVLSMPRDQGLTLDAANICRMNDTWLMLESSSGNKSAYQWLTQHFPDINIELCNFYAGVHIDSTITPIREGLVLLNGARVNHRNCPRAFDGWAKVYVNDVSPQGFYQYPYASKWIALNMLAIDSNTVIVDADQIVLIKILESLKIDVVPHRLRHSRTLGGGFHCVTLDTWREN